MPAADRICLTASLAAATLAFSAASAGAAMGPSTASCQKENGNSAVTITLDGTRPPNLNFTRAGSQLSVSTPVGPVPCTPDSTPELSEITSVTVDDQSFFGGPDVTIDQGNGTLGPGAGADTGSGEIEFVLNIAGQPDNKVVIQPLPDAADVIQLGALAGGGIGANLNGDGDGDDLRLSGMKGVTVVGDRAGESRPDLITLDGSQPYFAGPAVIAFPVVLGGGGDDRIVAGTAGERPFYTGEAGDDTIIGGAAAVSLFPIESIVGGPGRDTLRGGAAANRIDARDGGPDIVSCDGSTDDRVQSDEPGVDDVNADCEAVEFTSLESVIVNQGDATPQAGTQGQSRPLRLKVLRKRVPERIDGLAAAGVRLLVHCNLACRAKVDLRLPRRVARRLGVARQIGTTAKPIGAGESAWLRVKAGGEAAERLRDARGLGRLQVGIRISAAVL